MLKDISKEAVKGIVEGITTVIFIVVIFLLGYKYCYKLNYHYTLGDNYSVLEERIELFGNTICQWEREIPREPMTFVLYEKWF